MDSRKDGALVRGGGMDWPSGEVHFWICHLDEIEDPELLAEYQSVISVDEAAAGERFYFERDRKRHLVTRAMVRSVLFDCTGRPPAEWNFASNRHGRPEIADTNTAGRHVSFNISHSQDVIVLALAFGAAVGVDVESHEVPEELLSLADRFFAESEARELHLLGPEQRAARFLEIWTLKESYVKARGVGLTLPLDRFRFILDDPGRIRFECSPEFDDQSGSWGFSLLIPRPGYTAAVCHARNVAEETRMVFRRTVPLRHSWELPISAYRSSRCANSGAFDA